MSRREGGFTLIELLIVVAIIAILAAIAVPNFLEAQVRSKVARVKSDLRALAMAEEAYRTDWDTYTFGQGGMGVFFGPLPWEGFRLLTSPVAYITTIPMDPFGLHRFQGEYRPDVYFLGVGRAGVAAAPRNFAAWQTSNAFPCDTYFLESVGPNKAQDNLGSWAVGSYPLWPATNVSAVVNFIYDATNGTVSVGDIFRSGGTVPPGPALQVFYSATSGR
ncbi:prepilin-type N-terminal cleavage/methylation domain-containing protein [Candidatus Sumerlaeota bacterium]|nr:prepilin-type N-terminal cleavage/methylation domain-containing protein [Candidatus Sumerlaeota bacterium]